MKKVVHFEVHFVILYSKTELLSIDYCCFFTNLGLLVKKIIYANVLQQFAEIYQLYLPLHLLLFLTFEYIVSSLSFQQLLRLISFVYLLTEFLHLFFLCQCCDLLIQTIYSIL